MVSPAERARRSMLLVLVSLVAGVAVGLFGVLALPDHSVRSWFWVVLGAAVFGIIGILVIMAMDTRAQPLAPELMTDTGEALIQVARSGGWRDQGRPYKVLIDGKQAGTLLVGETKQFQVWPGDHDVSIRIDWTGSQVVRVTVPDGQTVDLYCQPKGSPASAIFQLLSRHGYVDLSLGHSTMSQ